MNPLDTLARIIQEAAEEDPSYRALLLRVMAEEDEKRGAAA